MGVKGLWQLLGPVARPIKLETMEGKRLAIDSSIWLYQFQATMRDKDGRVLVNAHVLGFLRRINKLLFHGIKPVFVFDGGAPSLKRSTIAERKRKKTGAAANHAKVAERLFAAQMRREAVKQAQALRQRQSSEKGLSGGGVNYEYESEEGEEIAEDAVYLDELDGPSLPRPARMSNGDDASDDQNDDHPPGDVSASRKSQQQIVDQQAAQVLEERELYQAERRKKFRAHDPYRLPDLPEGSLKPAKGSGNGTGRADIDPRMATEAELQSFIEDMKPEDFDLNSPDFRSLSTEMQYEIIGDLRVRSRQQSHKRLASMLRSAPTPLDFSKAQIASLSKRNVLTQQLLTVTDTIGTSGLQIATRVASERNREYVLIRNSDDKGGGWVLGVRDQGTKDKPIVLQESPIGKKAARGTGRIDLDSDDEVAEVPRPQVEMDPQLRALRQSQMLEALTRRLGPSKITRPQTFEEIIQVEGKTKPNAPLFAADEEEDDEDSFIPNHMFGQRTRPESSDRAMAESLQIEEFEAADAIEEVNAEDAAPRTTGATSSASSELPSAGDQDDDSIDDVLVARRREAAQRRDEEDRALLKALKASKTDARLQFDAGDNQSIAGTISTVEEAGSESDDESMEEVDVESSRAVTPAEENAFADLGRACPPRLERQDLSPIPSPESTRPLQPGGSTKPVNVLSQDFAEPVQNSRKTPSTTPSCDTAHDAPTTPTRLEPPKLDREEILLTPSNSRNAAAPPGFALPSQRSSTIFMQESEPLEPESVAREPTPPMKMAPLRRTTIADIVDDNRSLPSPSPAIHPAKGPPTVEAVRIPVAVSTFSNHAPPPRAVSTPAEEPVVQIDESDDETSGSGIDQDPLARTLLKFTPEADDLPAVRTEPGDDVDGDDDMDDSRSMEWSPSPEREVRPRKEADLFAQPDADLEEDEGGIDMNAEGDDYARFIAQIKGRNLDQVRQEIDNEIRTLNQQNKIAMRDSEDITQQMIAQIQLLLRLFGIPYVTAPMEAEAQCAELARLNLVDGVITDDNDVFLFGGSQCFKNLFNDAKYVECFLAKDLEHELSMSRDRLITIAYLLGSDYTIGLPGVGPVVAMELMANFPGGSGLQDFKQWWLAVQQGQDDATYETKWQAQFKKKFSDSIYIQADWPNPAVADAYHHPLVDSSDEPFQWGFPDLSGLRTFLQSELSWSISKVDDELTPIVQRLARRGQSGNAMKQTILDPFFDSSLGQGVFAPRLRSKLPSKRLQAVIRAFREAEARVRGDQVPTGFGAMLADLEEEDPPLIAMDDLGDEEMQELKKGGKMPAKRKRSANVDNATTLKKKRTKKTDDLTKHTDNSEVGAGAATVVDRDETGQHQAPTTAAKPKRKVAARRKPTRKASTMTQASSTSGGLWEDDLDSPHGQLDDPMELEDVAGAELIRAMEEVENAHLQRQASGGQVNAERPKPKRRSKKVTNT